MYRFHQELPLARIREHLSGQVGGLLAGLDDSIQQPGGRAVRRQQLLGQAGVADHDHQQVVEVVGDGGRQHADAFPFLGLP